MNRECIFDETSTDAHSRSQKQVKRLKVVTGHAHGIAVGSLEDCTRYMLQQTYNTEQASISLLRKAYVLSCICSYDSVAEQQSDHVIHMSGKSASGEHSCQNSRPPGARKLDRNR